MTTGTHQHAEVLKACLPDIIAQNMEHYIAMKTALSRRDESMPLCRDKKTLRVLDKLLAPAMKRHEGEFFTYEPDVVVKRADKRLGDMERNLGISLENKRYFDIGCGRGENITAARKRRATLSCGIDMDEKLYEVWREAVPNSFGMQFIVDDLHAYDFGDTAFDIITSYNSFEHFDDPSLILNRCAEIAAPGGLMYIDFAPLFHSAMGSHKFRHINVPYVQNLFDDDLVADLLYGDGSREPYPGLNRKRPADFRAILLENPYWDAVFYHENADYSHAWVVDATAGAMSHLPDDDLYVSGIICVLRRK